MMKKIFALALTLCLILTALPALAIDTQEEWDDYCNWVIAYDATLYSATYIDDATTTDIVEYEAIGSIAAGSRVSVRATSGDMRQIYYWNGGRKSAWIEKDAVRWDGKGQSSSSSGQKRNTTKISDAWEDFTVTMVDGEGTESSVTLQTLGSAQCVVYDGSELLTVPTASLSWETEAPEEQRIACIYAPRTGKATLRATPSNSAKSLGQCVSGRIVVVLKVGSVYSRVLYDGKEGCVLNDALSFLPIVPADEIETATLIYKGRTDSSATISMYDAASTKRTIDQYRVGNEVVVLGTDGSYTNAEFDGNHGWFKTQYLQ